MTYRELNRRANQLAHHLRALGVGPEVLVGVHMERSFEMLLGLLGILKAGGAYVPFDPSYPAERLRYMLEDAQVAVLLTATARGEGVKGRKGEGERPLHPFTPSPLHPLSPSVVNLVSDWDQIAQQPTTNLDSGVTADNLAYMIYTSGSTGQPKGAMNTHRGIVNRLLWMQETYRLVADDRVLQKTPFSFDVSVWEFFWPLLAGARLVLAQPEGHRDSAYLVELIAEQGITTIHFVPSMLRVFLEERGLEGCAALRRVICSGEALPLEFQERFFAHLDAQLHNLYGPTEAAVDVTFWACTAEGGARGVPIGRPLANTAIYLLDQHLNPVPIGVPGELHIGGVQVGRGYHRRADLTAERFIPNPFLKIEDGGWRMEDGHLPSSILHPPSSRLYKTGDLCRYREDGAIEFLGRLDFQVKLRGCRIELGEIEAHLRQHRAVRDATILVREDTSDDRRLVAYIVPSPLSVVSSQLQPTTDHRPPTTEHATRNTQHATDGADNGQRTTDNGLLAGEQIQQWQQVFDTAYGEAAPPADPTFNIAGWNSSYTNEPLAEEEMREWVEHTVARIRATRPGRVLEIGCGSGLLLFRIAPHCAAYWGTDVSPQAIEYLRRQLENPELALPNVTLLHAPADDFVQLPAQAFDLVILNSVVQYFPSAEYLVAVLEGAARIVAPGGCIFVGDVRSLPLLDAFHTAVELYRAPASLTTAQLWQRVQRRVAQDQELVVAPAFFTALRRHLPALSSVEVRLKRGRHHNELTRFRYDVLLRIGPPQPQAEAPWLDWRGDELTLDELRRRLEQQRPAALGIAGVPNRRLLAEVRALALLGAPQGPETVGDLRAALQAGDLDDGVDPEDLWELGDALAYDVAIGWSRANGSYDVLFSRGAAAPALGGAEPGDEPLPWSHYTNNPLRERLARQLVPALRAYLKEKVPDYMLPSAFVLLDELPLSPNGKLDRAALPAPLPAAHELEEAFVAPRGATETILAEIWAQVIGLERVSVNSNFFELGGDSLDSIRVIARAKQAGLDLTPRQLFQHQTIAELAAVAVAGQPAGASPVPVEAGPAVRFPLLKPDDRQALPRLLAPGRQIEDAYPLAPGQEHMLFRFLSAPVPGLYVWQRMYRIPGLLNVEAFQQALQRLVDRNPPLRTTFLWEGLTQPLQLVHQSGQIELVQEDWRGLSPAEQEAQLVEAARAERARGFPLDEPAAMRMFVAQVDAEASELIFSCHYMRVDGWSSGLLSREFFSYYHAILTGQELVSEPGPRYRDYIAWLQQQDLVEAEPFWRQRLGGLAGPTPLVARAPGNLPGQGDGFDRAHLYLPADTTAKMDTLARQERLTLNTLVQGAWALLLHRYTGEEQVVLGVTVSGRPASLPGMEQIPGAFINALPLRVGITPEQSLLAWLNDLRAEQIEVSQYEYTPLWKLRQWCGLAPQAPLFESLIVFQNLWGGDDRTAHHFYAQMEYPLRLDAFPESEMGLIMSYYQRYFDRATITRMLDDLQRMLIAMVANPYQRLSALLRVIERA